MAVELELSDYVNTNDIEAFKATNTPVSGTEKSERRLLKLGLLTLSLLCIIQAALNLSLRLAFHSKAGVDPFPFNNSSVVDLCQNEQLQQNSTQLSFCCNNLLMRLLKEYEELKRERDLLWENIQPGSGDIFFTSADQTPDPELE